VKLLQQQKMKQDATPMRNRWNGVNNGDKMGLTLGEAAKASGISKATISRAIKSGKLSANKADGGAYSIEPVELYRAFDLKAPSPTPEGVAETVPETPNETSRNTTETPLEHPEIKALAREVELLREMLAQKDEAIEREREMNGFLQDQLSKTTLLLGMDKPSAEAPKGFFSRLLGR
jgi:hypothetical protein